jgi:hypothetical protein
MIFRQIIPNKSLAGEKFSPEDMMGQRRKEVFLLSN